jgi:hypothetical protein
MERCVLAVIKNKTSNNDRLLLLFQCLSRTLEVATWQYTIQGRSGRFLVSEKRPSFLWHIWSHPAQWLFLQCFSICGTNETPNLTGQSLILVVTQRYSVLITFFIQTQNTLRTEISVYIFISQKRITILPNYHASKILWTFTLNISEFGLWNSMFCLKLFLLCLYFYQLFQYEGRLY